MMTMLKVTTTAMTTKVTTTTTIMTITVTTKITATTKTLDPKVFNLYSILWKIRLYPRMSRTHKAPRRGL